jgi:hypothetical protein
MRADKSHILKSPGWGIFADGGGVRESVKQRFCSSSAAVEQPASLQDATMRRKASGTDADD